MIARTVAALIMALTCLSTEAVAQEKSIVVASTTSTQDSGLFGYLLPLIKQKLGIEVKVLAQGTGQALDTARRGDADVVFVHARSAEEKFLAEGFGVKRYPVMYNDFVLIGPKSDAAGIKGKDVTAALQTIRAKSSPFVSRGDRSGTHVAELALWKQADIDIAADKGAWYKEIGQGMGAALNMASASDAYLLSDRGTWLAFKNRGPHHLVEGDKRLFNQYGVIPVNPAKHPTVNNGTRSAVHRLVDLARRPEGNRRLQDQRPAAFLSERQRPKRLTSTAVAPGSNRRLLPKTPSVHGTNPAFDAGRTNFRLLE
jgi:tungstate transport system substrate-binding protein